jgi:pimeloyl-ACP methyl ester carboxylesterase
MFHALRGQLQAAEPLPERAKQLESPVLALVGFYDRNVVVDAIRDLTTAIPDVKLVIFENSAPTSRISKKPRNMQRSSEHS